MAEIHARELADRRASDNFARDKEEPSREVSIPAIRNLQAAGTLALYDDLAVPRAQFDLTNVPTRAVNEKVIGYVAIGVRFLILEYKKDGAFRWLRRYQPAGDNWEVNLPLQHHR